MILTRQMVVNECRLCNQAFPRIVSKIGRVLHFTTKKCRKSDGRIFQLVCSEMADEQKEQERRGLKKLYKV